MLNCSFSVPCLTSARYLFAENRGGSVSLGERIGGADVVFCYIQRVPFVYQLLVCMTADSCRLSPGRDELVHRLKSSECTLSVSPRNTKDFKDLVFFFLFLLWH